MTLWAGQRLGSYVVLAPLGAGGMGEVYRARDTRLGREVAVKVLPAEFAADPERLRRFEQEARAAAALNHPNILVLHDIGSTVLSLRGAESPEAISPNTPGLPRPPGGLAVTEGKAEAVHYIVTELLEGESLRERLRGGPLTPAKAVEFGIQIAQGLAAAHERGIVHRDLKPENLFVTKDGRIKILDFGLARLSQRESSGSEAASEAQTAEAPTREGTVLGTPGYMAPEQLRGDSVDARSDLFAFGAVLYEMVTGKKAFTGATCTDIAASILKEDPPDLQTTGRPVPMALDRIVRRCLEKRPEQRFQSARDLAFDLEAVTQDGSRGVQPQGGRRRWPTVVGLGLTAALAVTTAVVVWWRDRPPTGHHADPRAAADRIAVLPFENLGEAGDAYFAAGVTDEVTGRLAGVRGLAVISRASASQYAGTTKSSRQIGEELQAGYLLLGTVRWARGPGAAGRVRITPQLVRTADDTSVWSEVYDFAIDDIFRVQSEIAQAVVDNLGLKLLAHERGALETRPTANLDAYQFYLRGKYRASQPHFTASDWFSALDDFQRATTIDPAFALAWAELAKAHARLIYYRVDISKKRHEQAIEALERARTLAGDDAAVHLAAGYYHLWVERDNASALAEFEAAAKSLPSNAEVLEAEGELFRLRGDWQRALDTFRAACSLSPRDASPAVEVAETCWWMHRHNEAAEACERAIALAPEQAWPHLAKVFNLWSWKGSAGLAEARGAAELIPQAHEWRLWTWYWQEAMEGRYAQSLALLDTGEDPWIRLKIEAAPKAFYAALAHSWLGDARRANAEFERARPLLEEEIRAVPQDGRYHSSLGVVYAALGRRDDALREGMRGVELMPLATDPVYGIPHVIALAHIYTLLGDDEHALAQLDLLLSRPGWVTVPWLRTDPRCRPLDSNPRFQALLAKYGGDK